MKTLDQDFPPIKEQHGRSIKPAGVYIKLMQARIELQGRKLNKSGHNKFAGYYYFELGDFLPVVQEIFAEIGLCSVISYGLSEAWLTITDIDDGSAIAICSPMADASTKGSLPIQALGSAQTYLRRYLWLTAMEIVEHDALDATTGKEKPAPQAAAKSEARSEWDKLDEETQKVMTHEAMAVTVMLNAGDIQGAFDHIATLEYDDSFRTAFESRLDSQQRAMIKNYSHIIHAQTLDSLTAVFKAAPKYAQPLLQPYATKRKQELQPMEAAA